MYLIELVHFFVLQESFSDMSRQGIYGLSRYIAIHIGTCLTLGSLPRISKNIQKRLILAFGPVDYLHYITLFPIFSSPGFFYQLFCHTMWELMALFVLLLDLYSFQSNTTFR